MKKGFTLVEIMAVILLIGLLCVFAIPAIVNQVGKKSEEVDQVTKDIIYSAAQLYITDQNLTVPNCGDITIQKLIDNNYLDNSVKKLPSGKEIPTNRIIKVTKDTYNQNEFELVKKCN